MSVELFGTAASVIVALSLMQKNIKWLRLMNFIGAACFTFYGYLIASWPVLGLNGFIAFIDLYYLIQEQLRRDRFDYMELPTEQSEYIVRFLQFHKEDILSFIPDAQIPPPPDSRAFIILRNALPVSLVVFREEERGRFRILLDYAAPQYRDLQSARFFFNYVAGHLRPGESIEFRTDGGTKLHQRYLKSMQFKPDGETEYIRRD